MYTKVAIKHFKTRSNLARALGISRAAVSYWGPVIPEGSAYKLESLTGGALKVNRGLYSPRTKEARPDQTVA